MLMPLQADDDKDRREDDASVRANASDSAPTTPPPQQQQQPQTQTQTQLIEDKFSPLKLEADFKRVVISTTSSADKQEQMKQQLGQMTKHQRKEQQQQSSPARHAQQEKQRLCQGQREAQEALSRQQGLAFSRLLESAAASMFDEEEGERRDGSEDEEGEEAGVEGVMEEKEEGEGGPMEKGPSEQEDSTECISPPLLSKHVISAKDKPKTTTTAGGANAMALMFAFMDAASPREQTPSTPAAAGSTPSFYARNAYTTASSSTNNEETPAFDATDEDSGRQDLSFESELAFAANEYNFDLDSILQRDLESYSVSPGGETVVCDNDPATEFVPVSLAATSPVRAPFPVPALTAPTPPAPKLLHRPLVRRADTSKVVLVDTERDAAAAKLAAFQAFLAQHMVGDEERSSHHIPITTTADPDTLLSDIMEKHRILLAHKIIM